MKYGRNERKEREKIASHETAEDPTEINAQTEADAGQLIGATNSANILLSISISIVDCPPETTTAPLPF